MHRPTGAFAADDSRPTRSSCHAAPNLVNPLGVLQILGERTVALDDIGARIAPARSFVPATAAGIGRRGRDPADFRFSSV
jgi:hypothetical protein